MTHADLLNMYDSLSNDEQSLFSEKFEAKKSSSVEDAWAKEISRRVDSIQNGTAKFVEVDDVGAFIRNKVVRA